ncbi:MAG TPA: RdgB/HAM1 family non-canonical purine NTP pyrophosphatase [Nitrososphaera sp.]|nr:RdgB/HAM1 family non-canonical purine NTP pyrophosphatase [Nitrososphaera sp.]
MTFASANPNKFREVRSILSSLGISVEFAQQSLVEIQSDSPEEIVKEKARNAYAQLRRPVIVEDDGLFIDSLNGFPGQYSSFTFKTIGNSGILRLLAGSADRSASFRSLIALSDGENISIFEGDVHGSISETITDGGWGYDPIFIPTGARQTFGQLGEQKNKYSHRRMALEKFAQGTKGSGYA